MVRRHTFNDDSLLQSCDCLKSDEQRETERDSVGGEAGREDFASHAVSLCLSLLCSIWAHQPASLGRPPGRERRHAARAGQRGLRQGLLNPRDFY